MIKTIGIVGLSDEMKSTFFQIDSKHYRGFSNCANQYIVIINNKSISHYLDCKTECSKYVPINHQQSKKNPGGVLLKCFQVLPQKSSKKWTFGKNSGGLFELCNSSGLLAQIWQAVDTYFQTENGTLLLQICALFENLLYVLQ